MRCAVCKKGETKPGKSVITLTKGKLVLVFKNVPAQICHDCSEEYINEETADQLLKAANESFKEGAVCGMQDWDKFSTG